MATEENDFVERWYPLLLRGERYKKHGTILVSNVRVQLHPSCRRLEYWKPPHLTRVQANEVKGIDVGSLLGVSDVQGLRIRVTGLDRGSEKTMNLETLDYKTKKEWMIALKALYSMRTIIASPEFSRVAHGNVTSQHNINEGRETNKYEYQQEKQQQQPPQRQLLPAVSVEQQERRTKWQERREARAVQMARQMARPVQMARHHHSQWQHHTNNCSRSSIREASGVNTSMSADGWGYLLTTLIGYLMMNSQPQMNAKL